jgi:hypothetical protein
VTLLKVQGEAYKIERKPRTTTSRPSGRAQESMMSDRQQTHEASDRTQPARAEAREGWQMSGTAMSRSVFEKKAKEHAVTRDAVRAAITNELLTRHRVEILEGVIGRSFLGRLRWILTGR